MIIRPEEEKDYAEVENLTREAFWNVYRPGCFEHLVVHKLRQDAGCVRELDYVVEDAGEIVAHIIYSLGTVVTDDNEKKDVLIFGPVSVLPEKQGRGYGSLIIEYTLARAEELGYPLVLITGNPKYYKRFGFVSASTLGIYYNGMDRDDEADFFMCYVINQEEAAKYQGVYYDPEVYDVDDKELEEYDKHFPEKQKKKRPGMFV